MDKYKFKLKYFSPPKSVAIYNIVIKNMAQPAIWVIKTKNIL